MNRPQREYLLDLSSMTEETSVTIGRNADCFLVIDSPDVSGEHCRIAIRPQGCFIRDLQSRGGTMVNRQPLNGQHRLLDDDLISIPGAVIRLRLPSPSSGATLSTSAVSVVTDAGRFLLKEVSVSLKPGELIGLVGLSGCGKSTLMRVLTGALRPQCGSVKINGQEAEPEELRRKTCFLPQEVIIHRRLSVREILSLAGKIFSDARADIGQTIRLCGLNGHEAQPVMTLSGGQQKRAGLAQELLFNPDLLCLDEVTSGLDPDSEHQLMLLFRELSDAGKAVLCITHNPERLELCDRLLIMQDGSLVFDGSPAAARKHFQVESIAAIYPKLKNDRLPPQTVPPPTRQQQAQQQAKSVRTSVIRQLLPLLHRETVIRLHAPGELLYMFLQGILIGLLIGWCFGSAPAASLPGIELVRQHRIGFALLLAAIWVGATGSVREIVKERHIIVHEARHGLSGGALLAAKFAVLTLLSGFTTVILTLIVKTITGLTFEPGPMFSVLLLTCACSSALGLALSAWSTTQEKALTILPVLIIGLVMFSGGINEFSGTRDRLSGLCCYSRNAYAAVQEAFVPHPGAPFQRGVTTLLWHGGLLLAVGGLGLRRMMRGNSK